MNLTKESLPKVVRVTVTEELLDTAVKSFVEMNGDYPSLYPKKNFRKYVVNFAKTYNRALANLQGKK